LVVFCPFRARNFNPGGFRRGHRQTAFFFPLRPGHNYRISFLQPGLRRQASWRGRRFFQAPPFVFLSASQGADRCSLWACSRGRRGKNHLPLFFFCGPYSLWETHPWCFEPLEEQKPLRDYHLSCLDSLPTPPLKETSP